MTISVDGTFGQKTAEACNAINPAILLPIICAQAEAYYRELEARRPEMKAWFANWNTRAAWMPPQIRTGFEGSPAGFDGASKIPHSDFGKAIELVIATHEGGFQKRVDDPGNWTPDGKLKGTKFGISAHSFPDEDIESLTHSRAEELYRQVWGRFALIADQQVLAKTLDLAVNMQWAGHGHATEILQRAVNECSGAATKAVAASSS